MPVRTSAHAFIALALVASLVGCRSKAPVVEDPAAQARRQLEEELTSAYSMNAPPVSGIQSFELTAAPTSIQQFDGRLLDVWAYNGTVPGPVLRVRLGEEIEVKLHNRLPQPTTIHWHGVRVPNAMDGVPGVTQEAVAPGASFTYRFTPKDAGTFWFHPHVRTAEQVERGLYGVLIVDDAAPRPYSRDEVWVLDDWRLGPDGQIDPNFVTRHDLAHDGRWGQLVTVNGETSQELIVRPGERIRLRLVNTSNGRVYRPDFSGLDPRKIAPANRVDLDIVIPHNAAGRSFEIIDRFTRQPFVLATVRVEGAPVQTPRFAAAFNPRVPKWKGATDLPTDVTYVLDSRSGGEYGIQWTINGEVWGEHTVTELPHGQWKRVRFQNDSYRLHPMHLHGQFFKVIAKNGEPVDEPFFRDTVLLHRQETIDVGIVPLDWGRWMMHCHILEHAASGMMTLVHVGKRGLEPPRVVSH
ncbi:MAG: multicopper oxidase family protein [Deltaproteobacteria bacterium]|nr:multicopper oxidase family protein [Deltaproteobacteria bacterium]